MHRVDNEPDMAYGVQVLHGDLPSALEAILGFLKVWLTFGFTPEKANIISAAIVDGQRRCIYASWEPFVIQVLMLYWILQLSSSPGIDRESLLFVSCDQEPLLSASWRSDPKCATEPDTCCTHRSPLW